MTPTPNMLTPQTVMAQMQAQYKQFAARRESLASTVQRFEKAVDEIQKFLSNPGISTLPHLAAGIQQHINGQIHNLQFELANFDEQISILKDNIESLKSPILRPGPNVPPSR